MSVSATVQPSRTPRRSLPAGMWGMALFLCSETMLFAGLIASYFYLDFRSTGWPPAGVALPEVAVPSILTGVLVVTSVPIAIAARRARRGWRGGAARMIGLAAFVQSGYLAYQVQLLLTELHTLHPQSSAYASVYFALLWMHHAHVALGILLDLGLLTLLTSSLSSYRITGVRVLALYWYVINAIAIAVLFTEISPSL